MNTYMNTYMLYIYEYIYWIHIWIHIWIHMKYLLYIYMLYICYISYLLHICYISVTYLLHCVWDVYDIFLTRLCCRGPMLLWMWPFSLHTNCSAVPDPWGCLWQRRGGTQRSCRSAVAEPSLRLIIMIFDIYIYNIDISWYYLDIIMLILVDSYVVSYVISYVISYVRFWIFRLSGEVAAKCRACCSWWWSSLLCRSSRWAPLVHRVALLGDF